MDICFSFLSNVAELSIHFKILNFFEMKCLRFRNEEINVMNIHITTGSLSVPSSGWCSSTGKSISVIRWCFGTLSAMHRLVYHHSLLYLCNIFPPLTAPRPPPPPSAWGPYPFGFSTAAVSACSSSTDAYEPLLGSFDGL